MGWESRRTQARIKGKPGPAGVRRMTSTNENLADILTKPLEVKRFHDLLTQFLSRVMYLPDTNSFMMYILHTAYICRI